MADEPPFNCAPPGVQTWEGDARSLPWPDRSVQCFVTSPPYWGQRDYGHPDQIGLEAIGRRLAEVVEP